MIRKIVLLLIFLIPCSLYASGNISVSSIKAAYIYHFTRFIEWPLDTEQDKNFTICILGKDKITDSLSPLLKRKVGNRSILIKSIENEKDIQQCKIIYIVSFNNLNLTNILNQAQSKSILTVSSIPKFAENGGMINFIVVDKKVRFNINLYSARNAKLKFSAKLLEISNTVIQNPPLQGGLN